MNKSASRVVVSVPMTLAEWQEHFGLKSKGVLAATRTRVFQVMCYEYEKRAGTLTEKKKKDILATIVSKVVGDKFIFTETYQNAIWDDIETNERLDSTEYIRQEAYATKKNITCSKDEMRQAWDLARKEHPNWFYKIINRTRLTTWALRIEHEKSLDAIIQGFINDVKGLRARKDVVSPKSVQNGGTWQPEALELLMVMRGG